MYEKVNPAHPDKIADRIAGDVLTNIQLVAQNVHLAANQACEFHCGDNDAFGAFR